MNDAPERSPLDQATIDQWRACYGLDKRTPADAARWWSEKGGGAAPAGCVAALGVALDELDALRKDAARFVYLESWFSPMGLSIDGNHAWTWRGSPARLAGPNLREAIDAAIAAAEKGTK